MTTEITDQIKCPECGSLNSTIDKATTKERHNICLECGKKWTRPNHRMTIGEAAKQRFLEIAARDRYDPYTGVIERGDTTLLHEIADLSGRRGDDHPWNCTARIIRGIARSRLFTMVGYVSYPERGLGRVAHYKLKTPEEIESDKRAEKIMQSPRIKKTLDRISSAYRATTEE